MNNQSGPVYIVKPRKLVFEHAKIGASVNANASECVFIGIGSGASSPNTITNAIALGYQAATITSNSCTLGNASMNKLIMGGGLISVIDDSAAAAAGIPVGGLYQNSGAVRIRLA
jgi:hypothetical protein